jgi:serine/threonine-protein kinase
LSGGQGYVYICHDEFLDRKVAIKVIKNILDTETVNAELAAMLDVRSPHVAEVYDLIFARRSHMAGLVQEFVCGESLETYKSRGIRGDQLTLWQLASGLADIHGRGRLHRDIKPSNIRFDAEGVLKILDFGIASKIESDAETVRARGTRGFLAPEFYGTPPIPLEFAADVYAFGVTTWYLVSNSNLPHPLTEMPPQRNERVPTLSTVLLEWPPDLVEILDRSLSVDPEIRPRIHEIREALEKYLLYGKHRATFSYNGRSVNLDTPGKTLKLGVGSDIVVIAYNGLSFTINSVNGDVYLNNTVVVPGMDVPGSCVFTLGAPPLGPRRIFVPMDLSHPEVIL